MKLTSLTLSIIAASTLLLPATFPTAFATSIVPNTVVHVDKQQHTDRPKIELVFVLDTTGSMSGLIDTAKEKIWSIASTMASAQTSPDIKIGFVAFRDRGDNYVTQRISLSRDLDTMYAQLMDFKANGGGDTPESVNQGLYDAVNRMSWSHDANTYKVIFLVGDAPAHMDYQDDVKFPETLAVAKRKGIIVNTIQAGQDPATTTTWQQISHLGGGGYFQVGASGNAVAISTPYDQQMVELSLRLDQTKLYYGNKEEKKKQHDKHSATSKLYKEASEESLARRATFNSSKSGKANFLGEGELVEAISKGDIELDSIATEDLPKSLQALPVAKQKEILQEKASKRDQLEKEMTVLAEKRNQYLKEEVKKSKDSSSFDSKMFDTIKDQAASKGLIYDADSAKY